VKLIHLDLNFKFDMSVIFMTNYFFSEDDVFVDSETLLVIDFVNIKIKSIQSFRCTYRDKIYIRIFIGVSTYTYINIYIYIMFVKKEASSIASGGCSVAAAQCSVIMQ
jgi:hypothetical protein